MKRAFEMNITGIDKRDIFSDKLQDFSGIRYKPLNNMDISSIHETSMRVFSEIGIKVKNKEAFELFARMAKSVDGKNSIVKLDPDTVMELISTAPHVISLYGQRPENTLHVGKQSVYAGTGGTALYVMDPGKNDRRDATLQDLKNIARVVDEMKNIDFFMLPVLPSDIPTSTALAQPFATRVSTLPAVSILLRESEK
jgi:trimethylamine--corrinoid protein Co-methyltransferase